MSIRSYRIRFSLLKKTFVLIPGLFLLFGFIGNGQDISGIERTGLVKQLETKTNRSEWKFGVNYTSLPLPKPEEGRIRYSNPEISIDYHIKPKIWLGTGLGMGFWEYHIRTVTRTIDQVHVDPLTNALSFTFIDSISGYTNKFSFISIPARVRFDLLCFKRQTIFISSGISFDIAYKELEGFEDNHSSGKTVGPPDSPTFFSFGSFSVGYEVHQKEGLSSSIRLDYCRTLFTEGIPRQMKNYFGATVSVFLELNPEN